MSGTKPRLMFKFMLVQAVRAENDEKRMIVMVSCSFDSVNKPIRTLRCLITGTIGRRLPEARFSEAKSEKQDAFPVIIHQSSTLGCYHGTP